MKNNVDLTLNNMFSSEINENISFSSKLRPSKHFLWNFEDLKLSSESAFDLVIVGNKREREKWREVMRSISVQYCDCCGKRINTKPWKFEVGVCNKCLDEFRNKQDKCIWRD